MQCKKHPFQSPLRNNRNRISASSSGVDVPEHKGDQADASDVSNISVFKKESDSHADQNDDDSSVVAGSLLMIGIRKFRKKF
jgi:hypothetical protein